MTFFSRSRSTMANFSLLSIFVLLAILLKIYYIRSDNNSLFWILTPTTFLVTLFSGVDFVFIRDIGYVSLNQLYIINKSCAGLNFFIITFLLSIIVVSPDKNKVSNNLLIIFFLILSSLLLTLIANSSRIYLSINLEIIKYKVSFLRNSEKWFHEAIGITTFFSYLLIYYFLLERVRRWIRREKYLSQSGFLLR